MPSAPPKPIVIKTTPDAMTVEWDECASNGGSKILCYNVECKERNSIMWKRADSSCKNRKLRWSNLNKVTILLVLKIFYINFHRV